MANLTVLGSGTSAYGLPPGYLLVHGGKNYLIEVSEGTRARLDRLKTDFMSVDNIFISHFHSDHFVLETFMQSVNVKALQMGISKKTTVYGPDELEGRFKKIWEATHLEGGFDKDFPEGKLTFHEFENGKELTVDDFTVTPYRVEHTGMPAFAMRFNIDGKIFAYSGDSGPTDMLTQAATAADLFLVECNQGTGQENKNHLTAAQIGTIGRDFKVKKIMLTHLPGTEPVEKLVAAVTAAGFEGEVIPARDYETLEI